MGAFCDNERNRLWAYLNDAMPTQGRRWLNEQRRVVDAVAARSGRTIERYVVESGGRQNRKGESVKLKELICEVRDDRLAVTLIVADATVLASRKSVRAAWIAALHGAGIVLKDTTGEFHPSLVTAAIDAVLLSPPRSPRRSPGRTHD